MSESARQNQRKSGAILALLTLSALAGPQLVLLLGGSAYDQQNLEMGAQAPSFLHWFGTDFFGRDLLARTLVGLRISLGVGLCAAAVAVGVGTLVGAIAGYVGGLTDAVLMRTVDVLYALPFMFLVIILVTLFGRNIALLFVALGLVGWLTTARIVRAQVMALKHRPFVDALQVMGASHARILFLHVLPNTAGIVLAYFTLSVPSMVLEEAFLSFLGLGVQPPHPSLGSLISDGASQVRLFWWPLAFPAGTLLFVMFALNRFGNACKQRLAQTQAQPAQASAPAP